MKNDDSKPDYFGHRERIRQKYLQTEGKGMADYELLELLLTYALPRRDVKPIAKELLRKFSDFNKAVSAPVYELMQVAGIKENSAILIKLVKSCALRATWEDLNEKDAPIIVNWDILEDYCRSSMAHLGIEEFHVIYLNSNMQVIKEEKLQSGTFDHVAIHPREVIKAALSANAKGIILMHNHPSGNIKPSKQDVALTQKIVDAALTVDLAVLDHVIVSKNDVYSMRMHDSLDFKISPDFGDSGKE